MFEQPCAIQKELKSTSPKQSRVSLNKADFIWESANKSYIGFEPEIIQIKDDPQAFKTLEKQLNLTHGEIAVGFISYDAARYLEKIKGATGSKFPDLYFLKTKNFVEKNRDGSIFPCTADNKPNCFDKKIEPSRFFSKEQFMGMVRKAKAYIKAGDVFQVVLSNCFEVEASPNPLEVYQRLKALNPSPYHFLIRFGEHTLVGASPEVMLRSKKIKDKTKVLMRPVAGTYPKNSPAESLPRDPKEQAEHIMLVDHARNDIGRVAEIASVEVSDLLNVETYRDVYHLVSQVSGILKPEENIFSALESCFPIATLTGTPKIRAMEIIAELEGPTRGPFGGAAMMIDEHGMLDSGVIIRSAIIGKETTRIQAGAGIVYDSSPEREYEECLWKAKAVIDAL